MDPDREIIVFFLVWVIILGLVIMAIWGAISIGRKRASRREGLCINPSMCCDGTNQLVNSSFQPFRVETQMQPGANPAAGGAVVWHTDNMAVSPNGWPKYENQRQRYMTDSNWIYEGNSMENDCLNAALLPHGQQFIYP